MIHNRNHGLQLFSLAIHDSQNMRVDWQKQYHGTRTSDFPLITALNDLTIIIARCNGALPVTSCFFKAFISSRCIFLVWSVSPFTANMSSSGLTVDESRKLPRRVGPNKWKLSSQCFGEGSWIASNNNFIIDANAAPPMKPPMTARAWILVIYPRAVEILSSGSAPACTRVVVSLASWWVTDSK